MPNYIVNRNAQSNGDYEVHDLSRATSCLPNEVNRVALGNHLNCGSAVQAARNAGYRKANGCAYCATACHTG